jgi:group I intron endonuclease
MADIASLSGIYQITNTVNGKRYIGSAAHFHKRWHEHRRGLRNNCHKNKHLQSSWNKHGEAAFQFIALEYCKRQRVELIAREQAAIDRLKPEYNKCPRAGSTLGRKASAETRAKFSARKWSTEHREKIGASLRGRVVTPEHKAAISAAKKGWKPTLAQRMARTGEKRSAEARGRMSDAKKGRKLTAEHKAKIAEAMRGREITAKQRAILSVGRAVLNAQRNELREARSE